MNKNLVALSCLVLVIFILNYSFLDSALISFLDNGDKIMIDRVIDGDTVVSNGTSIRLLGINSPERGEMYSAEATEFLEDLVLNRSIGIKIIGKDKYYRELAYLFVDSENVNLKIVRNGYANFYFPSGKDAYYGAFVEAWEDCLKEGKNICKRSEESCGSCIELVEWSEKEQRVVLKNNCGFNCDLGGWNIKDEGRKKFSFGGGVILGSEKSVEIVVGAGENSNDKLFWWGEKYVWTKSGDSMFLRDENGGLVLFESY